MPRGIYVRTAETRAKNSEASRGHPVTKETREKISQALKGRLQPSSAEVLARLREDPEFQRRQSEGLRNWWTPERRQQRSQRMKDEGRQPPSSLGRRRGAGFFYSQGYKILTGQQEHPLAAVRTGQVHEHRVILYSKIGPGPHPCHWGCGRILLWGGNDGIHADHLDGDTLNNDPDNLVESCVSCNRRRGRAGNPVDWSA